MNRDRDDVNPTEQSEQASSVETSEREGVSTQRRTFMKTVMTGAVAAGVVGAASKAQAQTPNACGPTSFPNNPVNVKVMFSRDKVPTLDDLHRLLDDVIGQSGCPNCGLGGVFDPDLPIAVDLKFEVGHVGDEPLTLFQDVPGFGR
ncbi:twin-arginine translocation signal domain-containing protein [Haliangium ochraceum]|uniref:Twin-arginine translocation signal domain-containing protein n=1 Tax=Haliangium ochraceum (strain DSM 14365 / JCM 11303 / SMP-2) TaxID=502025 RepID=D0LW01_HALO1|nr:twin-arginine translocation signal domain-containing protein [Haliangium ochraceum]ACY14135.1 hypothetical protein Hoch_1585 [Haliangium ochraceum DSM 14365]